MKPRNAFCSFCRKSHTEVGPLVEGPGNVYICGECAELCQTIVEQERRRRNPAPQPAGMMSVREKLDQLISGQEEAKQVLLRGAHSRNQGGGPVLLFGSSGSAQILLARAIAHALEVPFAAEDCNDLVSSRHGTTDAVPLLFRLLQASDFDLEAAQRGVVFVGGLERTDGQDTLLRFWQEETCHPAAGIRLTLRDIWFVCGSTFAGLDEAIARSGRHVEQPLRPGELTTLGVRPNWASSLVGLARVEPLDEENLLRLVQWVDFTAGKRKPADGAPARN